MDLEKEIFNLKLRCHEYEKRLQEIDLHGFTGGNISYSIACYYVFAECVSYQTSQLFLLFLHTIVPSQRMKHFRLFSLTKRLPAL